MLDSEATPGPFEVALRTWVAREKLVGHAYSISAALDLGYGFAYRLHAACREDNTTAMREHVADLLEAVDHELALRFF